MANNTVKRKTLILKESESNGKFTYINGEKEVYINSVILRNGDEELLIQLFRLLRCFPYEFLAPASLCLAELAVHHQSDFVKSEALSLMDHWGNKEVLRMMKTHEPPLTPWLKMKYYAIIDSLERYVALQENR